MIDTHYLDSGGTNSMNFSFVSHMSIPRLPEDLSFNLQTPVLPFSADSSKFAIGMSHGRVSVWDIRSKVPLKTFMEFPPSHYDDQPVRYLQFSSGKSGKEALVYVEVCLMFTFCYPYFSNMWFEFLAPWFLPSWNHPCDRCNDVWDRRNSSVEVRKAQRAHRTGCAFLRSKWGKPVRWTWRNTLWVGPAKK